MNYCTRTGLALALVLGLVGCGDDTTGGSPDLATSPPPSPDLATNQPPPAPRRAIIFVWDGLRYDSPNATDTPNLVALRSRGVVFTDNHSTYPTFTMMNGAAFATGGYPGTTGFYGNTLYAPGATGNSSFGTPADFVDPVFTEDYQILEDLDAYYNNQLLLVGTLFQSAQAAGLTTAAIGKSGPAFLQDYKKGGYILDERVIYPLSLAQEIQTGGDPLPKTTPLGYDAGKLTLGASNGDPTSAPGKALLVDGRTADPTDTSGAPPSAANKYMMQMYVKYVLPKKPDLTLIWFRSPDSPEHNYGPGAPNYHDALKQQDAALGLLTDGIKANGLDASTDIIIVSDHGHSNVSGALTLFPKRGIVASATPGKNDVGTVDPNGYSVSGDVRTADLLERAGFTNIFDGSGCMLQPVLIGGIKADNTRVYATQTDADGSICGKANTQYTTKSYVVPKTLPPKSIVIATNGGSEYIYVPDHDVTVVSNLIKFLQQREEIGAIFVHSRYNDASGKPPAGTLGLKDVKVENSGRSPDLVYSFTWTWDDAETVLGLKGTEYESAGGNRGMHGTFGTGDVHNTLIAAGPSFKNGFMDNLPSANVDVAPTVAYVLSQARGKTVTVAGADGRPLLEALATGGAAPTDYTVTEADVTSSTATVPSFSLPTNPATPGDVDGAKTAKTYGVTLHTKTLTRGSQSYVYFDNAKAVRN